MTPKTASFKERLRILVGENSVSSFGKKCGIGESTLRQYLKGGTPGLDKVIAMAKAAAVNIEWLATGEGAIRPGEKEPAKVLPIPETNDTPNTYDNFSIADKLQKTVRVLESDTLYRPALAANIDAFDRAVTQEKVVQDQQVQIAANKKQITDLEARMAVLENYLACATVTPDNYKLHKGTNENGAA